MKRFSAIDTTIILLGVLLALAPMTFPQTAPETPALSAAALGLAIAAAALIRMFLGLGVADIALFLLGAVALGAWIALDFGGARNVAGMHAFVGFTTLSLVVLRMTLFE